MAEQGKTLQKSAISRRAEDQWMGKIQGGNKIHLNRILDQHGPVMFRLQQTGNFWYLVLYTKFAFTKKMSTGSQQGVAEGTVWGLEWQVWAESLDRTHHEPEPPVPLQLLTDTTRGSTAVGELTFVKGQDVSAYSSVQCMCSFYR